MSNQEATRAYLRQKDAQLRISSSKHSMQTDTTASSSMLSDSAAEAFPPEDVQWNNNHRTFYDSSVYRSNKHGGMPHVVSADNFHPGTRAWQHHRAPSSFSTVSYQSGDENDSFINLLNETSNRWKDSAKIDVVTQEEEAQRIIQQQQEEIMKLQAQLEMLKSTIPPSEPMHFHHMAAETIDCAPVEHIEIDHESVASGLTHGIHATSMDDGSAILDRSLLEHAPQHDDAESLVATKRRRHRRTRSTPLEMHRRTNSLDLILEGWSADAM